MDIIALVEAKGLLWVPKAQGEIGITCPNAGSHQGGFDTRPSFDINLDGKGGYCFACSFALGPERLLKWLLGDDLDDMTLQIMTLQAKLRRMQEDGVSEYQESAEIFFPPGDRWEEDGYRGISLATYHKLGAVKVTRGRYADRIAFPIFVNGELKGVDARTLLPDVEPKYLRNKDSSCRTDWLYPYDVIKAQKPPYVILGEGIFHAVNGVDKGFPTLCYFGVHNFSLHKLRMIINLGVEEVIYFPDPDKAGRKAEQYICSQFREWLPVTSANIKGLGPKEDLGDLTADRIQKAIDQRQRPLIPACMPERQKIEFGAPCRIKCPFSIGGKCANVHWMKEPTQ